MTDEHNKTKNNSKLKLVICEDSNLWDTFCNESPEGTAFMLTWFTDAITNKAIKYFCTENSIPQAAVLIYLDSNNKPINPNYSVHHSFCFAKNLFSKNHATNISKRFKILEEIIKNIISIYKCNISFSFNPKIIDLRPLIWHNFTKTNNSIFEVKVRYTAIRNLKHFNDINDLLKDIRASRKQEYKQSLKDKIVVSEGASEVEVIDLYNKTFERQGITVDSNTKLFLKNLISIIDTSKRFILTARNKKGSAVSVIICLLDSNCAYSLIIANDPAYRKTGASTACLIKAMLFAKNIGKHYFDFVGANSPNRGDFKLSFNAKLQNYCDANLIFYKKNLS